MNFTLNSSRTHLLILGAGASVDYGLPTWDKLHSLISNKIKNDNVNHYEYKKEVLEWLNKIGENRLYKTVDECIKAESREPNYHNNGDKIENEIFKVINEIFEDIYKNSDSDSGWIRLLNDKIKDKDQTQLENSIAFINYNYDNILDKNFLNFERLSSKDKLYHTDRLSALSKIKIKCLYPHGFFSDIEPDNLHREIDTFKNNSKEYINAVSCYDSKRHGIELKNLVQGVNLYILGLGAGLEINLNNINFYNKITKIHITIRNKQKIDGIRKYLIEKFRIELSQIIIYEDCIDLINKCF